MAKNTCVNSVGQTKLKPTTLLAEQITPGGSAEHALHTWQTEVRFSSLIFCACPSDNAAYSMAFQPRLP